MKDATAQDYLLFGVGWAVALGLFWVGRKKGNAQACAKVSK